MDSKFPGTWARAERLHISAFGCKRTHPHGNAVQITVRNVIASRRLRTSRELLQYNLPLKRTYEEREIKTFRTPGSKVS
jgi:hypothetical protein